MISVHTEDFTDEENVFEVEKMLRQIPVKRSLTYKPDMFSVIGIYRNNKYNLKPVIYSRYKYMLSILTGFSRKKPDEWVPPNKKRDEK